MKTAFDYYYQWVCEHIRREGVRVVSLVNPKLQGYMLPAEMSIGDCLVVLDDGKEPCIEFSLNWVQVTSSPPTTQRP